MPPSIITNGMPHTFRNKDESVMTVETNKSTELATVDGASGQLEVNFEKNVTVLYDSISNSNWEVALRTLKRNPEEARTWVVRYHENENNGIMWRFLPLHSACARQPPTAVVSALLRAFPDAANCCDDQGMYPLHYACGNHASDEVIRALVDANPTAAGMGDPNGMVPMHYMSQWGPSSIGAIEALIVASPGVRDLQDAQGYTPLDYAQDGDYPERDQMVAALENNGISSAGTDEDEVSQENHLVYNDSHNHDERQDDEQQEEMNPPIESPQDYRRQTKKSLAYPPLSTPMSKSSPINQSTPRGTLTPINNSTPRGTPVQQQLAYWSNMQQQQQQQQEQHESRTISRTNSNSTPTFAQHPDRQDTISPAQPAWLTNINSNPHERKLPRSRSSTPTTRSNTPPAHSPGAQSTNVLTQWNERNDRNDRNDRPITAPAPVWNEQTNSRSQFTPNRNRSNSSHDLLPPRNDNIGNHHSNNHSNNNNNNNSNNHSYSNNSNSGNNNNNNNNNSNSNNKDNNGAPTSSVLKSLVKLNAEIVKLQAEAAFVEADMEERLLNQREAFQSQIDEVNDAITKSEAETDTVKTDLQAKDDYTVYIEKSTQTAERDTKQTIESNIRLERELEDVTRIYERYKDKSDGLQGEARELAKSMKVMRQEQEHILANLSHVEDDIGNASRARKKKLQAMFDEEMKYSMENVEMNRVGSGGTSVSKGLSVRQKLEEQKALMEKCDDILAECE